MDSSLLHRFIGKVFINTDVGNGWLLCNHVQKKPKDKISLNEDPHTMQYSKTREEEIWVVLQIHKLQECNDNIYLFLKIIYSPTLFVSKRAQKDLALSTQRQLKRPTWHLSQFLEN